MNNNNTLSMLLPGQKAKIKGFVNKNSQYREKILSMGLVKGTEFILTKKAPLGDPVEIEVMGYKLSLRKDDAEILMIEKISQEEEG